MEHASWCDQTNHDHREDQEQRTHPDHPGWTGCVGRIHTLDVAGITLSGNLLEPGPGQVCAVFEASRDGRLLPASFCLDVTDAARACAWVAEVLGQAAAPVPA